MKIRRKMSKAALTTLICLALSGSALAMPSGGEQVQGNVSISNGSLAAVANGATITVNGSSIINWQDFGIKNNEKLNIDTTNGALLNRVTSSKVSEILGTLTQKGNNPLLLVNPNGIVVGGGATINASNMVLSALAIDNDNFNKFKTKSNADIFVGSNQMGGKIDIQKGAKLNVDEALSMLGGTVNVADGVTFTMDSKDYGNINAMAGNNVTFKQENGAILDNTGELRVKNGNTTADNVLNFHGTIDSSNAIYTDQSVNFYANKINLDNAEFKGTLQGKDDIYCYAVNSKHDDISEATKENTITANNFKLINLGYAGFFGGNIKLTNSTAQSMYLGVIAANKYQHSPGDSKDDKIDFTANSTNKVSLTNSNLGNIVDGSVLLAGGSVDIDKVSANNFDGADIIAANSYNYNKYYDHENYMQKLTATNENQVTIKDSNFDSSSARGIGGGKVLLDNTDIDTYNYVIAANAYQVDKDGGIKITTEAGNDVNIVNDTYLHRPTVAANQIIVDKSELGEHASLWAGNKFEAATTTDGEGLLFNPVITASSANSINIKDSKVGDVGDGADYDVSILGGKIDIKNSKISVDLESSGDDHPKIYVAAGNNFIVKGESGNIESVTYSAAKENTAVSDEKTQFSAGTGRLHLNNLVQGTKDPEPTPEPTPEPAPTPVPEFSQQDKANIAAGADIAKGILGDSANQTLADCQQSFSKYVADLDAKAGSERAKAGQVLGILDAIKGDDSISLAEKQVLQLTVLNAYTPVKQAEQYNENVMTKANKMPEVNNQIEKAVKAIANTKDVQSVVEVEK